MLSLFLDDRRWPRIAPRLDEKYVGPMDNTALQQFCIEELMDAFKDKDVGSFRKAVEALVLSSMGSL